MSEKQVDNKNDKVLEELKNYPNWVNYIADKESKEYKKPLNPKTGFGAKADVKATWGTYEEAIARSEHVGFELCEDLPFTAIDIDHCITDGVISEFARGIIDRVDSYTEISPSGTGIHIFFKCTDKSFITKNKHTKSGFEIYGKGRYMTVTGNVFEGRTEIQERTAEAKKIFDEIFATPEPKKVQQETRKFQSVTLALDDKEVIERVCNNPKYLSLYNGEFQKYYSSQSEADLALCGKLAFYTDKDFPQIDRIFSASGLMREKWFEKHKSDGMTYGEMTIQKAIETCTQSFSEYRASKLPERLRKIFLKNSDEEKANRLFKKTIAQELPTLDEDTTNDLWNETKNSEIVKLRELASEFLKNAEDVKSAYEEFIENATCGTIEQQKEAWKCAVDMAEKEAKKKQQKQAEKEPLTTLALTQVLEKLGLNLRFNVITGKTELEGDYPQNSPYIHHDYFKLKGKQRREKAVVLLPEFLYQTLKAENYSFTEAQLKRLLNDLATVRPYNPLEKMFTGQAWDGVDRITELYKIMGIQDNPLYCTYVKKWLVQAVAMALNDDGKYSCETVLMLQSEQGKGKSEFFRNIALRQPEFYREGVIDMKNKDSIIQAVSTWIFEIGEANATTGKKQDELKSFITAYYDTYRRPYGENFEHLPRRTVFGGSVNPERFLTDTDGGSRRWACVRIKKIDSAKMRSLPICWYIQLWRQAYKIFCENPNFYRLTEEERELQERENLTATEFIPFESDILERLNFNAPIEQWNYHSASWVINQFELNKNCSSKIGKALTKIASYDKRVDKKVTRVTTTYLLPPLKNGALWEQEADEIDEPKPVEQVPVQKTETQQLEIEKVLESDEPSLADKINVFIKEAELTHLPTNELEKALRANDVDEAKKILMSYIKDAEEKNYPLWCEGYKEIYKRLELFTTEITAA